MILEQLNKHSKFDSSIEGRISKTVINHVTKNKEFKMNITKLSEVSETSQPSVTRFVTKTIGLKNYKEFINMLNLEVKTYFESNYDQNNLSDNASQIITDLNETLSHVSNEDIKTATNIILNSDRINVCAIGGNITTKIEIEHKLSKIGKTIMVATDWHQQLININFMSSNDVIIAVSYSGDKDELSKILTKAKAKNVKIILITGQFDSFAKSSADLVFEVHSTDAKFRSFSFTSRICGIAIWELIFKSVIASETISSDVIEQWKWEQQ
ncbi:MurR/RpiR family transcriptional regulator [Spiroplasma endosymbiont of Othius punctulatus]|uniref:MurR/RpiR family transcriptional regulator n=1 Tax=Spiroplasma endosymbiont of Othius punctulatus TaxID=3066289 RepID=UPI0030CE59E2